MIYHLLIAVAGVVGLMFVWLAVQSLVRRRSPEFAGAADADVLACRTCSCRTPDACGECVHASHPDSHPARATRT